MPAPKPLRHAGPHDELRAGPTKVTFKADSAEYTVVVKNVYAFLCVFLFPKSLVLGRCTF